MAKKVAEQKKKSTKKTVEIAEVLSSEVAYQGPLFRVTRDRIVEPGGNSESTREVVRHNGSVVILAVDSSKSKKDPWVVIERQYRHGGFSEFMGGGRQGTAANVRWPAMLP